jgi:prolycopene isomerase
MVCDFPAARRSGRRTRYDAVVIGTGVGGVVAGALLAKAGFDVIALERRHAVGGALASHSRDGFKVDRTGHLLTRGARGPFGWLWRELGLEHPRFLTHHMPVRSRGVFNLTAPASRLGLMRMARELSRLLGLSLVERARVGRMISRLFTLTEPELQLLDQITLETFLMRRIHHPAPYHLFGYLANVLFLLPPWRLSAGEAIRTIRWMLRDYSMSYVEGGLDCIPNTLLSFVEASGGDVVTGSPVTSVRRSNGRFVVGTDGGDEYSAPIVVANVPPKEALDLLEDIEVPSYYRARIAGLEPSGSTHTLRLGLTQPLVEEGCVLGGIGDAGPHPLSFERLIDAAEAGAAGRSTEPIAVIAPIPTNFDPTLAPEGHQLLVANLYAPEAREGEADAPAAFKDRALDALKAVIPGLEEAILFEEFQSLGPAMGSAQIPGQVGDARLPVTTPIPGFYLTGWGAGGRGIGIELAASSALEAYFAIGARN